MGEASERFTDGMCNFGPISQPGVQAPVADGVSASHAWFYRWEAKASKTVPGPTLVARARRKGITGSDGSA